MTTEDRVAASLAGLPTDDLLRKASPYTAGEREAFAHIAAFRAEQKRQAARGIVLRPNARDYVAMQRAQKAILRVRVGTTYAGLTGDQLTALQADEDWQAMLLRAEINELGRQAGIDLTTTNTTTTEDNENA